MQNKQIDMTDKITSNAIATNAIVNRTIAESSITREKLANAIIGIENLSSSLLDQSRSIKITGVNYPYTAIYAWSPGGD